MNESDWKLLRGIKKRALTIARCRWWSAGAIWRQLLANRRAFLFKMAKALAPSPLSVWLKKRKGCALRLLSRPKSSLRQRQVAATATKTHEGCAGPWGGKWWVASNVANVVEKEPWVADAFVRNFTLNYFSFGMFDRWIGRWIDW